MYYKTRSSQQRRSPQSVWPVIRLWFLKIGPTSLAYLRLSARSWALRWCGTILEPISGLPHSFGPLLGVFANCQEGSRSKSYPPGSGFENLIGQVKMILTTVGLWGHLNRTRVYQCFISACGFGVWSSAAMAPVTSCGMTSWSNWRPMLWICYPWRTSQ